jgi:hypothetical protein
LLYEISIWVTVLAQRKRKEAEEDLMKEKTQDEPAPKVRSKTSSKLK